MRYFFITQDTGLPHSIQYRDFDIKGGRHLFLKADQERLNEMTVLYLDGKGEEARPDFIQRPVTMFSERLQDILEAYEPELIFKDVLLIHKEKELQYRYVHTLMDQLEAISQNSEFYPNGMEKRLILDGRKAAGRHLFLLENSRRRDPLVSLPLAESLLRRNCIGIRLEEVEVE